MPIFVAPPAGDGFVGAPGGGVGEVIVATVLAVAVAPPLSVTVSVIGNVPPAAYVCDADGDVPVELLPSPQFHA